MSFTRREMLSLSGRSLLTVSLLGLMQRSGLATDEGNANFEAWLSQLRETGRQLGAGQISGLQWQEQMDHILGRVKLTELLSFVDFDQMRRDLASRDLGTRGEIFVPLDIGVKGRQSEEGVPEVSRLLIAKIAHIKKGRSIPPHGHSNMVSAFLCISGRFDVRLFDRLEEREDSMIVRKTVDEKDTKPGTWSSISDYRNNVHWLTAKTDDCFLFTSKLIRLEPGRKFRGRINIDVNEGKVLGINTILAPKISSTAASERY